MSFWIGFIIGLFIGGFLGVLTMSLMIISKQSNEKMKEY